MYGTNAQPADFKRLVTNVMGKTEFKEYKALRNGRNYKVVYVFPFKGEKTTVRLGFLAGDMDVTILDQQQQHAALHEWKPDELVKMAQALIDAATIYEAFYSVDQSTTR